MNLNVFAKLRMSACLVTVSSIAHAHSSIPRLPIHKTFQNGTISGTIQVSSEHKSQGPNQFLALNLFDDNPRTAWIADDSDSNPTITITFDKIQKLNGLGFQLAWKKSPITFLQTDVLNQNVTIEYDSSETDRLPTNLEDEATYPSHPFVLDGTIERRYTRLDTYSKAFHGRRIVIHGARAISEVRFLKPDSISKVYYPNDIYHLINSFNIEILKKAKYLVDVCSFKDSGIYGNRHINDPKKVVTLCSPYLRQKDRWRNFFRVSKDYILGSTSFRSYSVDSGYEVWLHPIPWEVIPIDGEGDDPPKPAKYPSQVHENNERYSYPVILLDQNRHLTGVDLRDGFQTTIGPEVAHLNDSSQTSIIDSTLPIQDTESVQIGKQVWMKRNISKSSRDAGSLCWGLARTDTGKWNRNCYEYGRLYRHSDAMHACPEGWHLPSKADWDQLFKSASKVRVEDQIAVRDFNHLEQVGFNPSIFLLDSGRWNRGIKDQWNPLGFSAKFQACPSSLRTKNRVYREIYSPKNKLSVTFEFNSSTPIFFDYPLDLADGTDDCRKIYDSYIFSFHLTGPLGQINNEDIRSESFLKDQGGINANHVMENDAYLPVRCLKNQVHSSK